MINRLWRKLRNLDEIERLNKALSLRESEAVDMTNLWWMACEVVGIPVESNGGKFRDAIKQLKHPQCDHSHTFKYDLPDDTDWYSSGENKGPHGPGLQLIGCYKCGQVWCRDYAA